MAPATGIFSTVPDYPAPTIALNRPTNLKFDAQQPFILAHPYHEEVRPMLYWLPNDCAFEIVGYTYFSNRKPSDLTTRLICRRPFEAGSKYHYYAINPVNAHHQGVLHPPEIAAVMDYFRQYRALLAPSYVGPPHNTNETAPTIVADSTPHQQNQPQPQKMGTRRNQQHQQQQQ